VVTKAVVEADLQADLQIPDAGFVGETELQKLVDLAGAEARQSREFVDDDDDVQNTILDVLAKALVLFAPTCVSAADDVGVRVNLWIVVAVLDEFPEFVELSLGILIGCRNTGVDPDIGHTSCGGRLTNKIHPLSAGAQKALPFCSSEKPMSARELTHNQS